MATTVTTDPMPGTTGVNGTVLLVPPPKRKVSERISLGHVSMIAAALLAFVLVVAVLQDRSEAVTVFVADREILPGTTVTAEMVREVSVPADSPLLVGVAPSPGVVGATASQRIGPGEPITPTALASASAPSGLRAMSVPIGREHAVGGDLIAGDRVDVIEVAAGTAAYIASDLEVLGTQRESGRAGALGSASATGSFYVSVAVSDATALALALAIDRGSLSVVRSTGAETLTATQPAPAPAPNPAGPPSAEPAPASPEGGEGDG